MRNCNSTFKFEPSLSHIPELDGLRGLAILSVLFYHLFWFPSPGWGWTGLELWIWKIAQVGWTGVNLFFVLSGFLITRILLSQKSDIHYFKRFYLRRILRIAPLYLLTLIFIGFNYPRPGKFILLSFFFLNHMAEAFGVVSCYPALWSLSIEEQFYFVWPQVVHKVSVSHLKKVALGLCMFGPLVRGISFSIPTLKILNGLVGGFDGLAFGALVAIELLEEKNLKRGTNRFFVLGALLLFSGSWFGLLTRKRLVGEMFLPTLIYLWVSALMGYCLMNSGAKQLKWFSGRFLCRWGTLSYAAYLCHSAIPELVNKMFSLLPVLHLDYLSFWVSVGRFLIYLLVTYVISSLLHLWIELPFLKLKSVIETKWVSGPREIDQENPITAQI